MFCCPAGGRKSRNFRDKSDPSLEQSIITPSGSEKAGSKCSVTLESVPKGSKFSIKSEKSRKDSRFSTKSEKGRKDSKFSIKSGKDRKDSKISETSGNEQARRDSTRSTHSLVIQWPNGVNLFEERSIITSILSSLSVNELLKLRLVNKKWNESACEVLRHKMEGVIILQRGLDYYTRMMSSSLDIPIGRIFLNILNMDVPQPKRFFAKLGHSIYYLVLNLEGRSVTQFQTCLHHLGNTKQLAINLFSEAGDEDNISESGKAQRKTPILVPNVQILIEDYDDEANNNVSLELPNLESIILSSESTWKTNEPFLLEKLVKASPNLKNLNLNKWPFPLRPDLFENVTLDNLQFLTVGYLANHDLEVLSAKKLRLKAVGFQLDYDVERDTFDGFLDNVSQTIQYISVSSQSNKNLAFRIRSLMPHLLTLRLTPWIGPIWVDTIAGNCENLMRIQLSNCDPSCISMKYPKSNGNVKYLAANFGNFSNVSAKIRSELVKNFIYAFPQLESFMMRQVSDKVLGQIVEGWPRLKTLRVTCTFGLTDSGLTGIPMAELSKMTKLEYKLSCGCCLPVPVVDWKPYVDNVRQYPHIGRLTDLVELSIESEEGSHFPLTNFSLHLGVHELTKLHSLKLTCHNELGPHWCFRCIADTLPNLKVLTVMDRAVSLDRYEEHEVLYLLRKLPNLELKLIPASVDHHHST